MMTFNHNNQEYSYPTHMSEVTLGKRIGFHIQYGQLIEERLKEISEIADETERELEMSTFEMAIACMTFSFFSGIELNEVYDIDIAQVHGIYANSLLSMMIEEKSATYKNEYEWNGEVWTLDNHELKSSSKIVFNEFLVAKEITRQHLKIGNSKWLALPYVCAIFFRKKGEAFDKSFAEDGSERLILMNDLPLNIALEVAFFLSSSMSFFIQNLAVSEVQQ